MPIRVLAPVVALLVLGATACASSGAADQGPVADVPAANAATAALLPRDALALPTFDYDRYQRLLGQLRGTPVVVNIWASWCGPCTEEAPHLSAAAGRFGARVQFLGVDILDSRSSARAFMQRFRWTYPSLYDESGSIRDRLGLLGQPVTLFYDASGKLASTWSGAISADQLTKGIRAVLTTG